MSHKSTDPNWYITTKRLDAKRAGLKERAIDSVRHGDIQQAEKFIKEADSLDFCESPSIPRNQENSKISDVLPVKVVRRRKKRRNGHQSSHKN